MKSATFVDGASLPGNINSRAGGIMYYYAFYSGLALTADEKTIVLQKDSDQACFPSDVSEIMSGACWGFVQGKPL